LTKLHNSNKSNLYSWTKKSNWPGKS